MPKYLDWRPLEGHNAPLIVALGRRGIGKTFTPFKGMVRDCIETIKQFTYVVETIEMVKTLSKNNGDKFFKSLIRYLERQSVTSNRALKFLKKLDGEVGVGYDEIIIDEKDKKGSKKTYRIEGGVIKLGKQTLGYILAWNDFANLKRNNFDDTDYIFFDEIISEKMDKTTLDIGRKVISLVQSIARTRKIKIYMCGNTIRMSDPILQALKIWNLEQGETRVVKDKYGVLFVAHLIKDSDYPEFVEEADASVAGRLATFMGQDNLDKGVYNDNIPNALLIPTIRKPTRFVACFHGELGSVRVEVTKDNDTLYIMNDYGSNINNRYCLDKRFITTHVFHEQYWYDTLSTKLSMGKCLFDTTITYLTFKDILKAV